MLNSEAIEKERRDYSEIYKIIETVIGYKTDPIEKDMKFVKEKLNSKVEIVVRNEERILSLEEKNKEEKREERFNWSRALAIISVIIALGSLGIALLIVLKRL